MHPPFESFIPVFWPSLALPNLTCDLSILELIQVLAINLPWSTQDPYIKYNMASAAEHSTSVRYIWSAKIWNQGHSLKLDSSEIIKDHAV